MLGPGAKYSLSGNPCSHVLKCGSNGVCAGPDDGWWMGRGDDGDGGNHHRFSEKNHR